MHLRDANPAILFLHDGELSEFREPLSTLGSGVAERYSGPSDQDRAQAWDLILASSKQMLALEWPLSEIPTVRIAVLDADSKTLRTLLRRAGTDLLVRRPVHPAALRLLILHALYQGTEKRRTSRVSVGAAIRFRSGLRRRNAILTELSPTGCRMLAPIGSLSAKRGASLTLQFSAELCGGRALRLSGRILRVEPDACGTNAIAVSFAKLRSSIDEQLRSVIAAHGEGPAMLESDAASARASLPDQVQAEARQSGADAALSDVIPTCETNSERRQQPRHDVERRVIALGEQASRVLIVRDLSAGGLRVDPAPGLRVGDLMKIALHIDPIHPPLVVDVEIARDDDDAGLGLRFLNLAPDQHELITNMLGELPGISEPDESAQSRCVFVSEVLERQSG